MFKTFKGSELKARGGGFTFLKTKSFPVKRSVKEMNITKIVENSKKEISFEM